MIKNFEVISENEKISAEDMELINRQSLKKLTEDEVFTFSVILCDNEIDRDFEVFSEKSLEALEKLFVGKTGILNHSNRSEDQQSRTYKTKLSEDPQRLTTYGAKYKYLKAWVYTVRSDKNADLIRDIESGIKKEVSISCSVGERVCSVCGESVCNHRSGKYYGDTLCYRTLEGVTDAYEWSFVAVPAQRSAGVTKQKSHFDVIEKSHRGNEMSFAKIYRNKMKEKAKRGLAIHFPELSSSAAENIICLCNAELLNELNEALQKKTEKSFPVSSQFKRDEKEDAKTNEQYKF